MIRYLLIRNWRGYEKIAFEPDPGLTFLVAENGTGKTSLLQAASWGLFGDQAGVSGAEMVRLGAGELSVEVELELNGQRLDVERRWSSSGRPRDTLAVDLDGAPLTESELTTTMTAATGLATATLNRLWFVPEMRLVEEGTLFGDIGDHLRNLLGIDRLEAVASRTKRVANDAAKRATQLKHVNRLTQERRLELERRLATLDAQIREIEVQLNALTDARPQLIAELASADAWRQYEAERAKFLAAQDAISRRAELLGVASVPEANVEAQAEASQLERDIASVAAEKSLVATVREQLTHADATCPVCLQQLGPQQVAAAALAHDHRLDSLLAQQEALEAHRQEIVERAQELTALSAELARLRHPEPPLQERAREASDIQGEIDALDAEIATANRRQGEAVAERRHAEAELAADDKSASASTELVELFATEAVAKVLAEASATTAEDRVEHALQPLTEAIAKQWASFFPGRGSVGISGGGGLHVRRSQGELRHSQLSGSEKVLSSLVTRMLFVASSTGLRSMWLDEPLEHLDPVNRVRAARLMSQAARPGNQLEQIVVTTYEEGLARTFASRHDHVHIRYVSLDDQM